MKFQLNTTEMLDWEEVWCLRCAKDHAWSHLDQEQDGCPLILQAILGEDEPAFTAHGDEPWFVYIPANVSCSAFTPCEAPECQAGPDAERRNGETRQEWAARLRAETLARPVVPND